VQPWILKNKATTLYCENKKKKLERLRKSKAGARKVTRPLAEWVFSSPKDPVWLMNLANSENSSARRWITKWNNELDLDRLNDYNNWRRKSIPIGEKGFKRWVTELIRWCLLGSPTEKLRIKSLKQKFGDKACPSVDRRVIRWTRLILAIRSRGDILGNFWKHINWFFNKGKQTLTSQNILPEEIPISLRDFELRYWGVRVLVYICGIEYWIF